MEQGSGAGSAIVSRLIGIAMIAAGLGLGWYFGWHPIEEARAGAPEVEYSIKIFMLAPMLAVAGSALLLGGTPVLHAFSGPPEGRQQHMIVWTVFAIAIVAGGLGFWWMQAELSALGYR
jgi:hypothetical protein